MGKEYLDADVLEASEERIRILFESFDNVLVAFSGGKDSTVCLNLCYEAAKKTGNLAKMAMYHLDYEAQYQATTDFVSETFSGFPGIRKYWICLPIAAQCCVNMDGGTWIPWRKQDKKIWVREMPESPYVISEANSPFPIKEGESDYEFQDRFNLWFASQFGTTAVVIGIRAQESLDRWRAICSDSKVNSWRGAPWATLQSPSVAKAYPIYDWTAEDDFTAFARLGWPYNRLYDLYYEAGLTPPQMRVASPFNDCAAATLGLYRTIDPDTWGRMVSRVNGANFAAIYGSNKAMGWKAISLPKGHTWESYCDFLLSTLPDKAAAHYRQKLATSIAFWRDKGGALEETTIKQILSPHDVGPKNNYSEKATVRFPSYPDDNPEVDDFASVPSYKRMCVCILKNDWYCKYMGFAQTKDELVRRKAALEKYKNL
jgi:predicted phosphoadenosine phosphosulfate sulfurtransferase